MELLPLIGGEGGGGSHHAKQTPSSVLGQGAFQGSAGRHVLGMVRLWAGCVPGGQTAQELLWFVVVWLGWLAGVV